MQRQRRAVAERATYAEEDEGAHEVAEEVVIVGRRKKPPSLCGHIVSSASPADSDVRRWETLAVLGFLHEFHPSFAVTIDPLALCSALSCGSKPDAAASTLIRELHLFLLRGISRGRAPVTAETWERVLHNRLNERIDELSEFSYRNPMADEDEEENGGEDGAEGNAERPSGYFAMNTEQRVRVLYLLSCWQLELSSAIMNEVERREGGNGNGALRLEPLGQDHLYHAYWHFASWPALLFREDERLWDVPHKPDGRWQLVCSSLAEFEAFVEALDEAQRDEKALRDVVQDVAIEPLLKEQRLREAAERRQAHAARHLGVSSNNILLGQRSRRVPSYRFEDLVNGGPAQREPILDRAARQRRREEEADAARRERLGLSQSDTGGDGGSVSASGEDRANGGGSRRRAATRGQENRRAQQKRGAPQRWGRGGRSESDGSEESVEYGSESDERRGAEADAKKEAEEDERELAASKAGEANGGAKAEAKAGDAPANGTSHAGEAGGAAKQEPKREAPQDAPSEGAAKRPRADTQTSAQASAQPEQSATKPTQEAPPAKGDVEMKEAAVAPVADAPKTT